MAVWTIETTEPTNFWLWIYNRFLKTIGVPNCAQATSQIPRVNVPPTLQALQRPPDPSLQETMEHYCTRGKHSSTGYTPSPSHLWAFGERTRFLCSWHWWIQISFSLDFVPWILLNFIIFYFYASIPAQALWKRISTCWFCGFTACFL